MNSMIESFFNLVKEGKEQEIRQLSVQLSILDIIDENGWTPLFWACSKGNLSLLKTLIKLNFPIEHKDKLGRSVFDIASAAQCHEIEDYLKVTFPTLFGIIRYTRSFHLSYDNNNITICSENGIAVPINLLLTDNGDYVDGTRI